MQTMLGNNLAWNLQYDMAYMRCITGIHFFEITNNRMKNALQPWTKYIETLIASYMQTRIPQFLRKHMQKKIHSLRVIVLNVYVQHT